MVRLRDVLVCRSNKELYELYKKVNRYRGDRIEIEYTLTKKTHDILVLYLCDALTDRAMFEAIALASFSHEYYNLVALLDNVTLACKVDCFTDKYGAFDDEYDTCEEDLVVPVLYEKWLEWGIVYIGKNSSQEYFMSITSEFVEYVKDIYKPEDEAIFDSVSFAYSCCCAMSNINGIVPIEVVRSVYNLNSQGRELQHEQLLKIVEHYRLFRDANFVIYNDLFVLESLMKKKDGKYLPDKEYFRLLTAQADKPFYIPSSAETIFDYDDSRAIWMDLDCLALAAYLEDELNIDNIDALNITSSIKYTFMENGGINDAFDILRRNNINLSVQCVHKEIIRLVIQIKDNIRLKINRGHTIREMRRMNYDKAKISETF